MFRKTERLQRRRNLRGTVSNLCVKLLSAHLTEDRLASWIENGICGGACATLTEVACNESEEADDDEKLEGSGVKTGGGSCNYHPSNNANLSRDFHDVRATTLGE